MEKLIKRNYESIVKRGLITPYTTEFEFIDKLNEEVGELELEFDWDSESFKEELSDVILVCFNIAYHYGIDIEKELLKKIIKNENKLNG